MPGVSLEDGSAWDDSAIQDDWNAAVEEYQKYHSIAKSGKRLEDVLTEQELRKLREEFGDVLDDETMDTVDPPAEADTTDPALPQVEANDVGQSGPDAAHLQDRATSAAQASVNATGTKQPHDGAFPSSMPQAVLNSVQDENMKNLMMSWYYAGYYTGLVAGQQQQPQAAAPDNASQQK